ncbi:MAG: hypothetical protein E7214_03900 [Clostridium sp.]|nr:hypothetical protein [Clostridium sp.]
METLKNITFEQLKNNFYKERTRKKFKKKYGDLFEHELLFKDDNDYDCPAEFIYSHDKYYEENPEKLISLAHELYELKLLSEEELVFDMAKKEIADILKDEYSPSFNRVVPRELTGGRTVFMTTLVVVIDEIENGFLDRRIYPLLVKDGVISALILNYRFYNDKLKSDEKIGIKELFIVVLVILAMIIFFKAKKAVNLFV